MYRPIETMPDDGYVRSVLTMAKNVRGCMIINGRPHYRNVHREWFDATREGDPPEMWWDGSIPGSASGRYRYAENKWPREKRA